jgi:uncharacterized damage-inducible protein DinB
VKPERNMELIDHLRRQFAYDAWANREVLATLRASPRPTERPLQLLAHILSAERLWLERIRRQPQSLPVWPEFFSQLTPAGLSENITYKNSKGEPWTSTVEDILSHVALHSAYHRGQIASQVRAGGEQPAHTDFIHAARQGLIKPGSN